MHPSKYSADQKKTFIGVRHHSLVNGDSDKLPFTFRFLQQEKKRATTFALAIVGLSNNYTESNTEKKHEPIYLQN